MTHKNLANPCEEIINQTNGISLNDGNGLCKGAENDQVDVEGCDEVQERLPVNGSFSDEQQIDSQESEEGYESCEEYRENESEGDEAQDDDDDDDDDDSGWITPSNLAEVASDMGGLLTDNKPVIVACVTNDFAMQVCIPSLLSSYRPDSHMLQQSVLFTECHQATGPECGVNRWSRDTAAEDLHIAVLWLFQDHQCHDTHLLS